MHPKMYEEVTKIDSDLKEIVKKTRLFNTREDLFEQERTDYSKVGKMMKEFDPYLNMWVIVNKWYEGSVHWNTGEWFSVDAIEAQNFVDDGSRKLAQVLRFFKDKDPTKFSE